MDSEYLGLQSSFTNGVKALVVIKVGADGSLNGYHNKYSLMAEQINATLGYAVLVISNPSKLDIQHNFDLTMQLVQKVYTEILESYRRFFIWVFLVGLLWQLCLDGSIHC